MDIVAKLSQIFRSIKQRMLNGPFEPQICLQPVAMHDCAGKSHAALQNDPGLLRIYRDRSEGSRASHELIECLPERLWLAFEVFGERIPPARVPEVLSDKPVPAFRATPERFPRISKRHGLS